MRLPTTITKHNYRYRQHIVKGSAKWHKTQSKALWLLVNNTSKENCTRSANYDEIHLIQ